MPAIAASPVSTSVDVGMALGRGQDQGVGHPQGPVIGAQSRRAFGVGCLDREDPGDEVGEESADDRLVVVVEVGADENLGERDRRGVEPMLRHQLPDRRVGRRVQRVATIEEGDDGGGVEDYRHSSRNPLTASPSRPSVSSAPL